MSSSRPYRLQHDGIDVQEIFVVTKLPEGVHPWTAVRQIVSERDSGRSSAGAGVRDHLEPMMPLVDELSRAELEGREADLEVVNAESRAAATVRREPRSSASPAAQYTEEPISYPAID